MSDIRRIPLKEIDPLDETFSVNFMAHLEKLRSSIEKVGLIQPIGVREKHSRYQIVSGFRRVSVCQELGWNEIEARLIPKGEDDLSVFSMSLHDNLTTRGFNSVEVAIALDKLVSRFRIDRPLVIETFLPLFSLETSEKILNTYLSLVSMEDGMKRYIVREEVSRSNIRRLASMTSEDRAATLSLLSALKLGENRLREVLTLFEEIAQRDHRTVREVIALREIQTVLSHQDLTPSQRAEKVKKVLLNLRYPKLHQLQETFETKRKELNLPAGLSLQPPAFFEARGMKIELQFETLEEYQSLVSSLSSLREREEFQEMLRSKHQVPKTK
jgi:ParB family chromosome partitioning protein